MGRPGRRLLGVHDTDLPQRSHRLTSDAFSARRGSRRIKKSSSSSRANTQPWQSRLVEATNPLREKPTKTKLGKQGQPMNCHEVNAMGPFGPDALTGHLCV
jgi:hypothetical protein